MHTFFISLRSISDVKRFCNAATRFSTEIDVNSGRYRVDAKSIMGLFSLDLGKSVEVEFHGSDADYADFRQEIAPYLTESA